MAEEDADQLVGRDHAVLVLRELMERPRRGRDRVSARHPVLVLEGARGSGKSVLLSTVDRRLDQQVPRARLDLGRSSAAGTPDMLSALAFQLSRSTPRYGALAFPRLTIGRLVMAETLDHTNRQNAGRQVTALLEQNRRIDTLREVLADTAEELTELVPGPVKVPGAPILKRAPGWALDRVVAAGPGRRVVLGAYQDWFGHRGRKLPHRALDVLVDLNVWARDPDDDEHRPLIRELLWDAFLSDLTDHFRSNRHTRELVLNCVALLDNADTPLGEEFCAGLVQARRDRRDEPDPLTVVVTSRGGLLADVPARDITELGPDGPDGPGDQRAERPWARLRLADLTEPDTRRLVLAAGVPAGTAVRLPVLVHRLTAGHPASTRLLVDAALQSPEHGNAMSALLDQPAPGRTDPRTSVAERIVADLLSGFPSERTEDLVTVSSAANRDHARQLAAELIEDAGSSFPALRSALWPEAGGAGPAVLRRLLLRRLAARPDGPATSWPSVFAWHRTARAVAGDLPGELYYALAAEDLPFVVDVLERELETADPESWRRLVLAVTAAPRRPPPGDLPPSRQLLALLRRLPEASHRELSRLVLALWIAGDPLTDSRRSGLHLDIAAAYDAMARRSPHDDIEPLLRAARESRRQAELWN